jgi:hypothetical protein
MNENLMALLEHQLGQVETQDLVNLMHVPSLFSHCEPGIVTRAELAQALNMLLFSGVLKRVPTGRHYTQEIVKRGEKVMLDHGALRTVRWFDSGQLPPGEAAITRILRPLGYCLNGVYPLEKLKMTGRSYAHVDDPENISQFFVSELHPERFSTSFQQAVSRVIGHSHDPLTPTAVSQLHELERDAYLPLAQALDLLPVLLACFSRQHRVPSEADYELLLSESAEMAWIATEGNVFNHATDRVADVIAVSEEQKKLGRPIKANVEISASGRVRQTAFKADLVERQFLSVDGQIIVRQVPGSFYELISRDMIPESDPVRLDLGFDTSNAQGIFKMTANSTLGHG